MKTKKKREVKIKEAKKARIYVTATFNNTLISATDSAGDVLCGGSSGSSGFKGARRATPYAASQTLVNILNKMKEFKTEEVEIYLKGAGAGREAVLRGLKSSGLRITLIADITPAPHNGVRPKKRRRV